MCKMIFVSILSFMLFLYSVKKKRKINSHNLETRHQFTALADTDTAHCSGNLMDKM